MIKKEEFVRLLWVIATVDLYSKVYEIVESVQMIYIAERIMPANS